MSKLRAKDPDLIYPGKIKRAGLVLAGILTFFLIAWASPVSAQANKVPVEVSGMFYNKDLSIWEKYPIRIYIREYAGLHDDWLVAGEGFFEAKARIAIIPDFTQKIIKALRKSQEWSEIAKKEKMETTKILPGFEEKEEDEGTSWAALSLRFFSANHGAQTDVILSLPQWNLKRQIDLYLNPDQVKQLITALEKIPDTYKFLEEQDKKAKKLK